MFHQKTLEKGSDRVLSVITHTRTCMYVQNTNIYLPLTRTSSSNYIRFLSYSRTQHQFNTRQRKKRQTFFFCHHITVTYIHRSLSCTFAILLLAQFFFSKIMKMYFCLKYISTSLRAHMYKRSPRLFLSSFSLCYVS